MIKWDCYSLNRKFNKEYDWYKSKCHKYTNSLSRTPDKILGNRVSDSLILLLNRLTSDGNWWREGNMKFIGKDYED